MIAARQLAFWDTRTSHDRLLDHIRDGDPESVKRALRGAVLAHLIAVFGCGGKAPCACGGTLRWLAPLSGEVRDVQVACPRCGRCERVSLASPRAVVKGGDA